MIMEVWLQHDSSTPSSPREQQSTTCLAAGSEGVCMLSSSGDLADSTLASLQNVFECSIGQWGFVRVRGSSYESRGLTI